MKTKRREFYRARLWVGWGVVALLLAAGFAVKGQGTLPAPANVTIDFDRDIQPIFKQSCLRCHGPERPKSGFRLDNRGSALQGGQNDADDIVPGDSEKSRLIRYVAGLEEGMEMPPLDKGDPLTTEQVSLLRAWIDQGANWGLDELFPKATVSVTSELRWWSVRGDQNKFRELVGVNDGFGGGLEHFEITQQKDSDTKTVAEGHVLLPENDLQLKLRWTKNEIGFVEGGFENARKYYDNSGGYYSGFTNQPQFSTRPDLFLDTGRAWINFGLDLPERPQVVLGYEFQYRDGTKSMLEWGNVSGKNIFPAFKEIHENVHVLKLDVSHDLLGWRVEDNGRAEFYNLNTRDQQTLYYTADPAASQVVKTRENSSYVQGVNILRAEKQLTDWWFCSAGCLYSYLDGTSSLNQTNLYTPDNAGGGVVWGDHVTLRREMEVVSLASSFAVVEGLNLITAAQAQFSRQEGFGSVSLGIDDPNVAPLPGKLQSNLDETKTTESAGLRYNRIPLTALFADARFEQDSIGQFERESSQELPDAFLRNTDFYNALWDLRAGFNFSPWRWVSLNSQFKHRDSDSHYDNTRDESLVDGLGYSAFIRERKIVSDSVDTRLVLHPFSWLKATLTYRRAETDYHVTTDPVGSFLPGGNNFAGRFEGDTYGASLSFVPSYRLQFSGSLIYSDSRTVTGHNEVPGVAPYSGQTFSVITSGGYVIDSKTSLRMSWLFTRSDYGQNNADGLPLGLVYTRHQLTVGLSRVLTKSITSTVRYTFSKYDESSSGGLNDFTANAIFASIAIRWP